MTVRELNVLEKLTLFELEQAVKRENVPPEKIDPQVRPFDVKFWLEQCLKVYNLGSHLFVQEVYQKIYGRPVPDEYLR